MCGIFGIFSFEGEPPFREKWHEFVNHLYHRGPDEGAWWADGAFILGHRRLSIIDLNSGSQPMATPDGQLVTTFNGEIYNYLELRDELERRGYLFQTKSDTEVLLQGYRAWGVELPKKLIGQFAFVIADRRRNELFLARDRFGEKPLFFRSTPTYFAFASELRSLAAFPDLQRELNLEGLAGYLLLNYVPGNLSLLKGVYRLPPASWMLVRSDGKHSNNTYWSTEGIEPQTNYFRVEDAVQQFWRLFDNSVNISLRSDVPVGIFLSGGLDSSLVADAAFRLGKLSAAYFLDFAERSYSEYASAKEVAKRLEVPLFKITLSPDILKDFFQFVNHGDDPNADSSAVNVWTLAKLASQRNKVVLGGDGGDELFGGYLTYRASLFYSQQVCRLPLPLRRFFIRISKKLPTTEGKVSFSYKLRRFLRALDLPASQAHFTWNGTWLPDEANAFIQSATLREYVNGTLHHLAQHLKEDEKSLIGYQRADLAEYLPNDILAKVDRMSMAHGLEVRAPFLNYELAEWAMRLPEDVKTTFFETKIILRTAASRIYGKEIAYRPKQGFSIPIHQWVRENMKEILYDLLSPQSISRLGIFDPEPINKLVQDHLMGKKSYGFELWGLMVLVAWHRARIECLPNAPKEAPLIHRCF